MIISVASGKSGTGKALMATGLPLSLSDNYKTERLGCDVQEPNVNILSHSPEKRGRPSRLAYHHHLKQEGEGMEFIDGHSFGSTEHTIGTIYKKRGKCRNDKRLARGRALSCQD